MAIQSSSFGTPGIIDKDNFYYRAGFEENSSNGSDTKVQKWDAEGNLVWTLTLSPDPLRECLPVDLIEFDGSIYLAGVASNANSSNADYFLSRFNTDGTEDWTLLVVNGREEFPSSLTVDEVNKHILITGSSSLAGNHDVLLASVSESGQLNWSTTFDHNGLSDLGLKVQEENGQILVSGSSQSSPSDWDMATWVFDAGGELVSEKRNNGVAVSSDKLKNGVLSGGFLNLVGTTASGGQPNAKLLVLDAAKNYLWHTSYDLAGLEDEFSALVAHGGAVTVAGFATQAMGNRDLLIRKYDQTGGLLWHTTHDAFGQNDQAVGILEDLEGNYLVLANVTQGGQSDVYLYCFNGQDGALLWEEPVGNDPLSQELAVNLRANLFGEVYITYSKQGVAKTKTYSYKESAYPPDNEPFSKGSLLLEASGRIIQSNGKVAKEIKYASFGLSPEYFFSDAGFSTRMWTRNNDSVADDYVQRVDFLFRNNQPTRIGHLNGYDRPVHFNYYLGEEKFEQQKAFDVLSYPEIYPGTDAFVTTNSSGFKLVLVFKDPSADINRVAWEIHGATGTYLQGGDVKIPTIKGDLVWMSPVSYLQTGVATDDNQTHYYLDSNGLLRLQHSGDLQYPYVVQIKSGPGLPYFASAINNMDWSTFFGGDGHDGAFDVTVDPANGDLYVAGFTESEDFPIEANISPSNLNGKYLGLVAKFDHNAVLQWVTLIGDDGNNFYNSFRVKGIELFDNIPGLAGKEVHIVGEYRGDLSPEKSIHVPSTSYQQTNITTQTSTELFFATLQNDVGAELIISPLGGAGHETANAVGITGGGVLYLAGSATASNSGSNPPVSSPTPPANHTLPVFDPGDGSYFLLTHPSPGSKRGYVAALDLNTYQLAYASLVAGGGLPGTDAFTEVLDIKFRSNTMGFCGRTDSGGKLGGFVPSANRFATALDSIQTDHSYVDYWSSCEWTQEGWVYFGLGPGLITPYSFHGSQYQSGNGQSVLLRYSEASERWKTSFGGTTSYQYDSWNGDIISGIDFWGSGTAASGLLPGRGKLCYDNQINTLFSAGSADGTVPTLTRPGYFCEVSNATGSPAKSDIYLNAFSYRDNMNPLYDHFTWGTMYGANVTSGGMGQPFGYELLGDVQAYTTTGSSYVVTVSTSSYGVGSTTSNLDLYPVADLGQPGSWFKQDAWGFVTANEIAITRFDVTNFDVGLDTEDDFTSDQRLNLYPNPSTGRVSVKLPKEGIASLEVFDLNGRRVGQKNFDRPVEETTVDLSHLPSGMYIIKVNTTYHAKISKL